MAPEFFIQRVVIENFGCIQHMELPLTPLHCLVGPNDSGKSTVLRALKVGSTLAASGGLDRISDSHWQSGARIAAQMAAQQQHFYLGLTRESGSTTILYDGSPIARTQGQHGATSGSFRKVEVLTHHGLSVSYGWPNTAYHAVEWSLDALRAPSRLFQRGQALRFQDSRGTGLPGIYDVILNQRVQRFLKIQEDVCRLFPTIDRIGLENESDSEKVLAFSLKDERRLVLSEGSAGLAYYLAFASLSELEPTAMYLVEEPENGLHPARIREVMAILREISKTTQVVITTHSPLVLNEMQPEEVTVLTRTQDQGTVATPMRETANFERRSEVYSLGALWAAYADGNQEAALIKGVFDDDTPETPEPPEATHSEAAGVAK
jgi:predicted ATPase